MARPHTWSLRRRLMALAAIATIAAWLTGGVAVLLAANKESEKLYDERLRDVARVILSFADHELNEIREERPGDIVHEETAATLDARYRYQIWSDSGELLLVSHDTRRTPFAPLDTRGYLDVALDDRTYCVYALASDDGTLLIQVAEDETLRDTFFVSLNGWLLLFFAVSTATLMGFNRWMFGHATRALDQSARQLLDRSADDLRPIVADHPPRELAPLLQSINTLFGRFERALDAERHFTAAAAHELRTPLAAVRVQAQVAGRARSRGERHDALVDLGVCVDRAGRMIDQLLTLARLESKTGAGRMTRLRVDDVAAHVMRDLEPLLREKRLQVAVELNPCEVTGLEFGVAAMLRNLIDNAARYTPPEGSVRVATGVADGAGFALVEDSGPGIPQDQRQRVFERFYRLADTAVDGCGVGLSIVQCVARAHGACISLADSPLGGLRAAVSFPASAAG
jgi:signal transduction histidine kinase